MNRRNFIKSSLITVGGFAGIGGGAYLFVKKTDESMLTVVEALKKLDTLSKQHLKHTGQWDLYTIFTHCAQSIEYSMSGFPSHNSDLFKATIGKIAFSLFSSKGKMTHGLSEAIPGAEKIISNGNTVLAINQLKQTFIQFDNYQGKLAPHFAYGELTKREYEMAHVMHLYNHFDEVLIATL